MFGSQAEVLAEECAQANADVVIAGHCGVPFMARVGGAVWFNPGVIGMPGNDGTTDVWYGLLQPKGGALQLTTHRLRYDHMAAAAAMRRVGYANGYARALVTGVWPSLDVFPAAERAATGRRLRPRSLTLTVQAARESAFRAA